MKLYSFNISNFKVDGGAMFGVVPKVIWNRLYPADENNLVHLALRSMIIDDGKRVVLIYRDWETDRKSTRLNSSHSGESRMPSSA